MKIRGVHRSDAGISIVALVCLAILSGCDFLGEDRDKKQQEAESRMEAERERQEKADLAEALARYADAATKISEKKSADAEKAAEPVRADILALSSVSEKFLGDSRDKKAVPNHETGLLLMMRDQTVNSLAVKYLGTDFTRVAAEFVERIRTARSEEERYNSAIAESQKNYKSNLDEARRWASATTEQREAEIERMRRDISSHESQRQKVQKELQQATQKTLSGNPSQERSRRERIDVLRHRLFELDREIYLKRRQMDFLKNPDANRDMVSRATERSQMVQSRANNYQENELSSIERHLKPKKTVIEVVAEFSAKTIEKLNTAMSEKVSSAEKVIAEEKSRMNDLAELKAKIPIASLSDLKSLRSKYMNKAR